jgi:non-ribosomal peptide synthetase component F
MPQSPQKPLREYLIGNGAFLRGANASVCLDELVNGSSLDRPLSELAGRSVLLVTRDQLTAALALIELDGIARRIVLCLPDLPNEHLSKVIALAQADALVHDPEGVRPGAGEIPLHVACGLDVRKLQTLPQPRQETEWVLLTSGTTGAPKLVGHTLASLTAAITTKPDPQQSIVWATFYDIRRYGGLQIFLRAILGGTSLVLSSADEPMTARLERLGRHGVTHLTGTPSHWRWALLNPAARAISPRYVRLSGEIADQSILDSLQEFYPAARSGHAYASTEAGVGI